ncbi:MCE family protein [Gordonia amarae]|uniref:Mce family protein n=2 Tax=Gordonia amarae TaxID=36821 RepID=G7GMN9_9ACTN|nr:MCE family protein [Gordonia amarae]MCS3880765.1 phospholipid/cholesterol/gamma-HCH transport system substrate-binding protein [Gordonia amarae]QHN19049.1 MCE family protein [Gordonia amarae]QHN23524.1 MCE family protein [Gordonia amarae]QHN32424.1 MCE family protein [Gordonia amarae]QHN41172.1 MCE family protein [Gordonia amarae]
MKSMPSLLIKIGVFAAVMAVILVGVLRTIEKPIRGDVTGYTALFTDANGLRVGNDVREFGVSVGKVTGISLKGTDAKVTFDLQTKHRVAKDARFAIRYQNLTGQRYIDIQQSTLTPAQKADLRAPGSTIDTGHTVPSFDVTTVFNGLEPVLRQLSPAELNKFTGSLYAVIEGNGSGIGQVLDAVEQLSRYAVDRQQVISVLVRNLSRVSDQIGGGSGNTMALINQLTKLFLELKDKVPLLAQFADEIPPILFPLEHMLKVLGLTGDPNPDIDRLIAQAFPKPEETIASLNRIPGFLQFVAAVTPEAGKFTCSKGTTAPPAALTVLLGNQRITLCRA